MSGVNDCLCSLSHPTKHLRFWGLKKKHWVNFYHYRVVVFTLNTFQFKQHGKKNFASDDPLNIYMYILCNISGVKYSPLQSWSLFFYVKNISSRFISRPNLNPPPPPPPTGISFLCAPPQLHISANLSTSLNGSYCVLPSISPCYCVFAVHSPLIWFDLLENVSEVHELGSQLVYVNVIR